MKTGNYEPPSNPSLPGSVPEALRAKIERDTCESDEELSERPRSRRYEDWTR